ncbi:lysine--tRNA ligase [Aquirhabdus sp.]|uniref:lysine--tRNA ligase n=1 Tax=Aquirhabdus sp. TaxID=2824160 RepID=UPI00396C9E59
MTQQGQFPANSEKSVTTEPQVSENELIAQRHAKLKAIQEKTALSGGNAFPNTFRRNHYAQDLHEQYADVTQEQFADQDKVVVQLAGRVMLKRVMGKASFLTIQDMSGRIQLYVSKNDIDETTYDDFKTWDLGDIVGVEGYVFRTKMGELSVHATRIELLTKSLRPLPDKFHGLSDTEAKYRARHLDLITNDETRKTFIIRAQVIAGIRQFLLNERFMEVETPMMHIIPGGAAARPFATHHNALDMPLYLRIAPELYLKRLVVGGFERVFEINRNFRNEGVSTRHNPEFTMIEFYQAYADYKDLMKLTEDMLEHLALQILGTTDVPYQGEVFNFKGEYKKISMANAILEHNPEINAEQVNDREFLANFVQTVLKEKVKDGFGLGKLQTIVFEETVETKLRQPTFITEYPAETSPLARRNDHNPHITDRFEFFIGGRELANGFSELNDPIDQAERFRQQVAEKDAGDDEAMHFDADFVEALEYGLPPTAGQGIGIDRLVMLFADAASIRDVILFPHMRRKEG